MNEKISDFFLMLGATLLAVGAFGEKLVGLTVKAIRAIKKIKKEVKK